MMNIDENLSRLKTGNERYVQNRLERKLQDQSRREELVAGQSPFAIILSCSDSRVIPEMIFDAGLGELFVVRVAGNIANTESIASIEYAVADCGAKVIVILGHESCGAVAAAVQGGDHGHNLNHLLSQIKSALDASGGASDVDKAIKQNARHAAQTLLGNSKILSKFFDEDEILVLPAYYNLQSGKVDFLVKDNEEDIKST